MRAFKGYEKNLLLLFTEDGSVLEHLVLYVSGGIESGRGGTAGERKPCSSGHG